VSGTLRERRGRWWRPRHGLLALAVAAALGGLTAPASAATNPFTITLVARQCHAYTDVMANLARNDIQESLRDLGKNSVYSSGQRISPSIEDPNNPNCTPITGWRFTFGDGINGADTAISGSCRRSATRAASSRRSPRRRS